MERRLEGFASGETRFHFVPPFDLVAFAKLPAKKNDAVVTAGGILGTVANIAMDKNEVTIKVDDNTRIRVQMRSVWPLPKEEGKAGPAKSEDPKPEVVPAPADK